MEAENEDPVLYFAFGSNLSTDRIHVQNKSAVFRSVAVLKGYKLEFCFKSRRWGGSTANIVPDPQSEVYGVLWQLKKDDLLNLDKQEGVAAEIYQRSTVSVTTADGESLHCLAYQLTEKTRSKAIAEHGEHQVPSKAYKTVIINGAKEHNLPLEYINLLEHLEDNGFDDPVNLTSPD